MMNLIDWLIARFYDPADEPYHGLIKPPRPIPGMEKPDPSYFRLKPHGKVRTRASADGVPAKRRAPKRRSRTRKAPRTADVSAVGLHLANS